MSRNYAVLERSGSEAVLLAGAYSELIRRLFGSPAVVAVIGCGNELISEDIAAELVTNGKRVMIVAAETLLRVDHIRIPCQADYIRGGAGNVWRWPAPTRAERPGIRFRVPASASKWIKSLRLNFDAVLLDCPAPGATLGSEELAAMADSAVLVVEAGKTGKLDAQRHYRALQSKRVNVAGCILIRKR